MMGQEGKTASQLQIDIPANVFVCCEKWCRNSHLHSPAAPPPRGLSSGFSLCSESRPAIHFQRPKLYLPLPSILTAPDHRTGLLAFCSHCIPGSHFLVAIETHLELLSIAPHHLSLSLPCPSWHSIWRKLPIRVDYQVWTISVAAGGGVEEKVEVLQGEGGSFSN